LIGVIFVHLVTENLALPHLSGSLLALAGISTSVHLGFELLERRDAVTRHFVEAG